MSRPLMVALGLAAQEPNMNTIKTVTYALVLLATLLSTTTTVQAGDPCSPGVGCEIVDVMWDTYDDEVAPQLECAAHGVNALLYEIEHGGPRIRIAGLC